MFSFTVLETPYEEYKHEDKYEKWKEYLHNVFEKRVDDIQKFKKNGKVLEVGCSLGYFMDKLIEAGFQTEGLEPSKDAVLLGRKRGLTIHKGYLEKNALTKASYDVVILNHVMEHVKDLQKACESIRSLLRPGGIVFIESPNFGSIEGQFFKSSWRYLYPTEHYSQFSPSSLQTLLSKNGFTVLSTKTSATPYDFASFPRELARCVRLLDWKRLVVYAIELPLSTIEVLTNRGTAVQCIAKKSK